MGYIKWMYKNLYKNRTKVANNEGGVHCRQKQQQQQDRTNDDNTTNNGNTDSTTNNEHTDSDDLDCPSNHTSWKVCNYSFDTNHDGSGRLTDDDCKNNSSAWSLRSHFPPGGVDNFKTDQELIN